VNLLALSFSLLPVSSGSSSLAFDYRRFWTYSTVTNVAAVYLADRAARMLRDEAFLGGLLCDISQLVLVECAPKQYGPVLDRLAETGRPLHELEREILGLSHMEVGRELLDGWGLPPILCDAIGAHHEPERLEAGTPARRLAEILTLATVCGDLYAGGELEGAVESLRKHGEQDFGMDSEACDALLGEIQEKVPEAARLYELDTEDPATLAETRARAAELLVRESLALNAQVHQVSNDAERLEIEKKELQEQATTDQLTGLRNRGFFDEVLASECERAEQQAHSLGLLFLDLDHFKAVNDNYGHPVGDELLREVGRSVSEFVRDGECGFRYGGEEIVVLCPEVSTADLRDRAEELREAVARITLETDRGAIRTTASLGGCVLEHVTASDSAERLLETADRELYRAKAAGRNRIFVTTLD
jgi:diguanylate cyclase (GGDEF)-like protein